MKTLVKYLLLSTTLLLFLNSCKNECNHDEINMNKQNSERPSQAITYPEMASMFKEYDNGQRNVLNEYRSKITEGKDSVATISVFYSLSEIKQYIAYVERLSKEKEINLTGLRIFTSAYPADYKLEEYRNRISFILAPTTNIGEKQNVAYEPLKSKIKDPVSMMSILNKYADDKTKTVNRASIFNLYQPGSEESSALNRGQSAPPY